MNTVERRENNELEALIFGQLKLDTFMSSRGVAERLPIQPGKIALTPAAISGWIARKVRQGIVQKVKAKDIGWGDVDVSTGKPWPEKARRVAFRLLVDPALIERTEGGKIKTLKHEDGTITPVLKGRRTRAKAPATSKDVAAIQSNLEAPKPFVAMSTGEQRENLTEQVEEAIVNLQVATNALMEFTRKHT